MPIELDRAQVMAYRIAVGGLHRDKADPADLAVLDVGVQQTVADSIRMALAARVPDPAATDISGRDEFAVVWTHRGAPHLTRTADLRALAGDLWPRSEADAIARLDGCGTMFRKTGISGLDAWTNAANAMHEVVTKELTRGTVSTEVTKRLPAGYSYDCRSCKATHIYGSLFQVVGLAAGVQVFSGSPTTLAPVPNRWPVPKKTARPDRAVRAYLHVHGPATLTEVAGFFNTTRAETRHMLPDDAVEVIAAGRKALALESDVDAMGSEPEPELVRLLPPYDPFLQPRDRELLVPNEVHRKSLWKIIANPGAVLVDGEVLGTWRSKIAKKRLAVTVEEFAPLPPATRKLVAAEANRIAEVRGMSDADVSYG